MTFDTPPADTALHSDLPGAPDPEVRDFSNIWSFLVSCSIVLVGVVTVFVVLDQAQSFFAPVLSAFVTGVVLSPVSRFWQRVHMRPSLAAFATMVLALLLLATLVFVFEPYVSQAINRAPIIWFEFREAIRGLVEMLRGIEELSADVAEAVDPESGRNPQPETAVAMPKVTDAIFYAPQVAAQLMIFAGALYFFLLTRRQVYAWFGQSLMHVSRDDLMYAEHRVARYFLTISTINACFGLLVAGVMHLLGMPAPAFWGMMAFLLNYILYLGPIVMGLTLLVAGLVVFDGPISIVPAALYMGMNAMEGQFVTPSFVGHQMSISPLLVFLSLVFWIWLWGPIGGMVAIPLMIWFITVTEAVLGQTISSGIPGMLRPNRRAGADE